VLLILIHAWFGIHILERGIIFVDLAMAQFIALGIAVAFLMGHEGSARNYYAVAFAVIGAAVFSMARRIQRIVNMEAFIGVLYIFPLRAAS
jgi:zinc/manganese transport system permease protein